MNRDFETIVMNTYAELCVMWRIAHVANQAQAEDFDAKLMSLEAVIVAFDLATPNLPEGATPSPRATNDEPMPRAQNTPPAPQRAGMILED